MVLDPRTYGGSAPPLWIVPDVEIAERLRRMGTESISLFEAVAMPRKDLVWMTHDRHCLIVLDACDRKTKRWASRLFGECDGLPRVIEILGGIVPDQQDVIDWIRAVDQVWTTLPAEGQS